MQINLENIRAVLARLENATGADRELDARLEAALSGDPRAYAAADGQYPEFWNAQTWFIHVDGERKTRVAAELTASLDAADALRRRVLPGVWRKSAVKLDGSSWCEIGTVSYVSFSDAPTEPLAILLATIRALIAKGETS